LHAAVARADEGMIKLLLANKPNVDAVNQSGATPLADAASLGNTNILALLLAVGADPNLKSPGGEHARWTPLHMAINSGQNDCLAMLLQHKADPNARVLLYENNHESTPLLMATARANLEAVELLLSHSADPNLKSVEGNTPLLITISSGEQNSPNFVRILQLLLEHGADPNAPNRDGTTALMLSAYYGQREGVELLIAHKADLNAKNKEGLTALHYIAREKNRNLSAGAELILKAGADPNLSDAHEYTPLSYAMASSDGFRPQIAELLRQHGAVVDVPDFTSLRLTRMGKQTVIALRQDTNHLNRFTLFETLVNYFNCPSGPGNRVSMGMPALEASVGAFPFPDWSRLKILRPIKGKLSEHQEIPAYVLNGTNTFDCSKDMPLEFGDVIELPEREHALNEKPTGLTHQQWDSLQSCLAQEVTFHVKSRTLVLPAASISFGSYLAAAMRQPQVQSLLTSSSDLARVKVTRLDPKTNKAKVIVEDVEPFWNQKRPFWEDLWLRDGDVIEVPDKK
jgi:ankyrin repeat protein